MTLTVVVGASGSGKTTFLNDVAKQHKCTYIRQYHGIRPYITVSKIPRFDPTNLPYWDIYVREGKAATIKAGGTMAGEFTAGLSGGQRKLLLFELIYQRTMNQSDLLLVLDEPFAGVTDDFVPFIVERLNEMRKQHNILLVTNDHVQTLKTMADNTITVSAIDRSMVQINGKAQIDRAKMILALSVGEQYQYNATWDDLRFFYDVEVAQNGALMGVLAFTVFAFGLFLATFWDSTSGSGPLVIVAASIIAFFCLNPYLLSLVDWRNFMTEEAEALLHASKTSNKVLKTFLTLTLILIVSLVEWGLVNLVIDGFEDRKYWVAILMDSVSMTLPFIFFGLFTKMTATAVEIFASMPFLFMIFFSGTFSPSAGVPVLKELRYLFSRFYFWCMIEGVQDQMEGCPNDDVIVLYTVLSGLVGTVLFLLYEGIRIGRNSLRTKHASEHHNRMKDNEFVDLQIELFGAEKVLGKESLILGNTSHHSRRSRTNSDDSTASPDRRRKGLSSSSSPSSSLPLSRPATGLASDEEDVTEFNV